MISATLSDISQSQRERLFHIDFKVCFLGTICRNDLITRFGIKAAAATRDFSLYKERAPQNLMFNATTKTYIRSDAFTSLFSHTPQQALAALAHGFGDDFVAACKSHVECESPSQLNKPELDALSVLTRAISQHKAVELTYRSLSSGQTTREVVPFVLVDNGLRWHVRAFDRRRSRFTDFLLNRISNPRVIQDSEINPLEEKTRISSGIASWS